MYLSIQVQPSIVSLQSSRGNVNSRQCEERAFETVLVVADKLIQVPRTMSFACGEILRAYDRETRARKCLIRYPFSTYSGEKEENHATNCREIV